MRQTIGLISCLCLLVPHAAAQGTGRVQGSEAAFGHGFYGPTTIEALGVQGTTTGTRSFTQELTFTGFTDFGRIHVLTAKTFTGFVRATNTGSDTVTIQGTDFPAGPEYELAAFNEFPVSLEPGQRVIWNFWFYPQEPGELTADLVITSDADGSPHTITIRAEVVDTDLGPWDWEFIGRPQERGEISFAKVDIENEDVLYVGSTDGLYITRDGGVTWDLSLPVGYIGPKALAIDPSNPGTVYAASQNEVFLSLDKGTSWTSIKTLPLGGTARISAMTVSALDGSLYVPYGTGEDGDRTNPGVYKTSDQGASWSFYSFNYLEDHLFAWDVEEDPESDILYTALEIADHPQPYKPPFFRSVDRGVTWEDVTGILPWHGQDIEIDNATQDVYFLTEGAGLYKSTDHGLSWERINFPAWGALLVNPHNPVQHFLGEIVYSRPGITSMSSNCGITFEPIGLADLSVSSLSMNSSGTELFASAVGAGVFAAPIIQSTNDGPVQVNQISDVDLTIGGASWNLLLSAFISDLEGDALSYEVMSSDEEITRVALANGILSVHPEGAGIATVTVVAESCGGSLSTEFDVTVVESVAVDLLERPEERRIVSVYPNPVRDQVRIVYAADQRGEVSLEVFDLLGRRIDSAQGYAVTPGENVIEWSAVEYPPGLYSIRLSINGKTAGSVMIKSR